MSAHGTSGAVLRKVRISDIDESGRHRKDLGELMELCRSIEAVGLLHPIVLDENNRLIAGARRIAAFVRLGEDTIPAYVVKDFTDAAVLLKAERDENTCRKDFTPGEAVALGKSLERLERPKARERQAHGNTAPGRKVSNACENFTQASSPRTRDLVGSAVGMSGITYERARAVVAAAEREPDKYGPVVEEMNRTGKVSPAYEKVYGSIKPSRKKKADRVRSVNGAESKEVGTINRIDDSMDAIFKAMDLLWKTDKKLHGPHFSSCKSQLVDVLKSWKSWKRSLIKEIKQCQQ